MENLVKKIEKEIKKGEVTLEYYTNVHLYGGTYCATVRESKLTLTKEKKIK